MSGNNKKDYGIYLLLFLLITLIIFNYSSKVIANNKQQEINISTGKWLPWAGENIKDNGFVLKIVREAFKLEGYQVNYEFMPWKRAIELLELGKVNASAYWYRDKA
ncbi:MAG: hypothetical protein ACQERJ_04445, partial [Bacillota bacterium]